MVRSASHVPGPCGWLCSPHCCRRCRRKVAPPRRETAGGTAARTSRRTMSLISGPWTKARPPSDRESAGYPLADRVTLASSGPLSSAEAWVEGPATEQRSGSKLRSRAGAASPPPRAATIAGTSLSLDYGVSSSIGPSQRRTSSNDHLNQRASDSLACFSVWFWAEARRTNVSAMVR